MLVNKSGRRLVIGRINVKNGEVFPGIPFTADERKAIEKFIAKGYIADDEAKEQPAKAAAVGEVKVEPVVEAKAEPVVEEATVEEPKVEEPKAEEPKAEPAYAKYSRRRKKTVEAEAEAEVKEDGVGSNG